MDTDAKLKRIRRSLHELAQPLAAVTGLVDLLLLEGEENSQVIQEVQMISDQLQRVLEIVSEMRRLTREPLPEAERLQALSE
jgi:signal transduction histidine kinase